MGLEIYPSFCGTSNKISNHKRRLLRETVIIPLDKISCPLLGEFSLQ